MSEFASEIELDVRYRDLDPMGHVNNAVYASYIEQARIRYIQSVVGATEIGAVVATLELEFERPVECGGTVTVAVRAGELGTTSIPFHYEIRTEDGLAATAETLLVVYDREADEPRPIPEAWRDTIRAHEGR